MKVRLSLAIPAAILAVIVVCYTGWRATHFLVGALRGFASTAGEAQYSDNFRINFPAAKVQGQTARLMLDTGSSSTVIFDERATRLGVKIAKSADSSAIKLKENTPVALSEPTEITVGMHDFTIPVLVMDFNIPAQNPVDGMIGWSEVRDNILVFDAATRTVRVVDKLPPETAHWLKLKLHHNNTLTLETAMPDGSVAEISVDTGSDHGVALGPEEWRAWRAAHPQATISIIAGTTPELGGWKAESAFADEVKLGALTLTAVPVREALENEIATTDHYIGTLGLESLSRMDLVVDGKNGVAFARPREINDQTQPGDWTVAGEPTLKFDGSFFLSGVAKSKQKDAAGALADINHALEINPDNVDALVYRGTSRNNNHDYDGAMADFAHALEVNPQSPGAWEARASARMLKDPAGSIADFTEYLKYSPKDALAYAHRAGARFNQGDFTGAVADYSQSLDLNPKDSTTWLWRGFSYARLGNYSAAIGDYTRRIELLPKKTRAYESRGDAKASQGDWAGALADYDKFVELAPDDAGYPRLLHELLQLRSGRAPADFSDTVAAWKDGWPKTIGQYLAGHLDESALLAAAEKKDTEAVSGQRCEADYFIGEMHLIKGDQAGAREFFNKCLATGKKDYREYDFARAELAELDAASK